MIPADIAWSAITVAVRTERVVRIPGGDPERLELLRIGGEYEGNQLKRAAEHYRNQAAVVSRGMVL